jgi:hypothetical protein
VLRAAACSGAVLGGDGMGRRELRRPRRRAARMRRVTGPRDVRRCAEQRGGAGAYGRPVPSRGGRRARPASEASGFS